MTFLDSCNILENGGDGVRYVHHDGFENTRFDRTGIFDFCTFPTTASQIFPVDISVEQSAYVPSEKECTKVKLVIQVPFFSGWYSRYQKSSHFSFRLFH